MVKVLVTEAFVSWLQAQTEQIQDQVAAAVHALEIKGVTLGMPVSSQIKGRIRELRCAGGASPARVFYAFDSARDAVLLCGGLKTDANLYADAVKQSEAEFARHEESLAVERARKEGVQKAAKKRKSKDRRSR